MYTREEEAIHFVFKAFNNMKRIKEDIPLAFHSISVAAMLKKENCDEDIVLTGLLHDIIEDSDYTYKDLKDKFGSNIAENVLMLSEKTEITDFKERKKEFILRLESAPKNIIIVEIADKLQNLLSDYELYKKEGKEALKNLNITYKMNKWYYLEMLKLFENKVESNNNLLNRYKEIINIYFKD